jgi:protein gp37
MAYRLKGMGNPRYRNGFEVTLHHDALALPAAWRKPQMIFVNSMSDLFHRSVPVGFIRDVFAAMQDTPRHTFQVLTKRAERLAEVAPRLPWPDNVWAGVTVEAPEYLPRLNFLRTVPAAVRFVSFEPLLGPVAAADLEGINWVIVGGESGPGARPMQADWVRDIRDKCVNLAVPFFFKQWGGARKREAGRVLDGMIWRQLPSPRSDVSAAAHPTSPRAPGSPLSPSRRRV